VAICDGSFTSRPVHLRLQDVLMVWITTNAPSVQRGVGVYLGTVGPNDTTARPAKRKDRRLAARLCGIVCSILRGGLDPMARCPIARKA
jgi:hypothetical protein